MTSRASITDLPRPGVLVAFVAGYAAAVILAEHTYGTLGVPSPFWLPDSALLCALLLAPRSQWWVFALLVWPVRLIAGAVPGTPLWFQAVTIANDMVKGLAAAWLLNRLVRRPIRFATLHEFMLFLAVAGALLPAASALAAAPARQALGGSFWPAVTGWFLGDAVTQVVITPTILLWCRRDFGLRVSLLETIAASTGLAVALYVGLLVGHAASSPVFIYLPVPFLIWVAARVGPFGAANALSLLAIVAMLGAMDGRGIFTGTSPAEAVLSIQLFLIVAASSVMSLAILVGEREALRAREAAWNTRLIDAQEAERSRIAGELHDDISQQMMVLLIEIQRLAGSAAMSDADRGQLRALSDAATRLSTDIRGLSHSLHPLIVDTIGVEAAVGSLCRQFAEKRSVELAFRCDNMPTGLPRAVSLCAYRLIQEGLHNIVKHSGAVAASVEVAATNGRLTVTVNDTGRGFDPAEAATRGLGLISMRERVRSLGGTLDIDSAPQAGTRLRAVFPVHADSQVSPS